MAVLGEELIIRIGADTADLKRGITDARSSIDLMTGQTRKLGNEMTESVGKKATGSFKSLKSEIMFVRSNMLLLTAVATALAAPILKADDAYKEFDATLGMVGGKLDDSHGRLMRLASAMGETVWEATDKAKRNLVSFGGDAEKSLKAAEIAARGAALGLYSQEEAIAALTPTVKAYNVSAVEMDRTFAIINKGALETSGSLGEFSGALVELAPKAKRQGVALDEVAAGLITLQKAGSAPSESIAIIESLLTSAKTATVEQAQALDQLSINYTNLGTLAGGGLGTSINALISAVANGNEPIAAAAIGSKDLVAALSGGASSASSFADSFTRINGALGEFNVAYSASISLLDQSKALANEAASAWGNLASAVASFKWPEIPGSSSSEGDKSAFQYQQMFDSMEMKAMGGKVGGIGVGDTVPAMLTPGEFVIKKEIAEKMQPFLSKLNAGGIDPSALWNTSLAGTRVGNEWLLNLLGIDQKIGLRGEIVSALTPGISDRQRELSAIASAMRREVVGFSNGGPVGNPTPSHSTTIEGGVNINVTGSQFSQAMIRRQVLPMIQREVAGARSRLRRSGR